MKQFAIYDPYLHILGGAERYVLSIALSLEKEYEITIFSEDRDLLKRAEKKFGLKFNNYNLTPWSNQRTIRNCNLKNLDLFLYVTDGSIFFSKARKNILLIQSPQHIPKFNLINQIKFLSWQKIICYSRFMAEIIKKQINHQSNILFVPIRIPDKKFTKKENIIVTVGRFFPQLHNKKQLEMVTIFKKMIKTGLENIKLIIIGSIDPGAEDYFYQVKKAALNLPVEIIPDISYRELSRFYQKAKVYWHAAGFNENLEKYPEKAEHFGVSTVEAMSHGCVPVVFNGGGQKEIVKNNENGFIWNSEEELVGYTLRVLQNEILRKELSQKAINSAENYSLEKFAKKLNQIID